MLTVDPAVRPRPPFQPGEVVRVHYQRGLVLRATIVAAVGELMGETRYSVRGLTHDDRIYLGADGIATTLASFIFRETDASDLRSLAEELELAAWGIRHRAKQLRAEARQLKAAKH